MEWHYAKNGQQAGPVSEEEFGELIRRGAIGPSDLVWNETLSGWEPAGQQPVYIRLTTPAQPAVSEDAPPLAPPAFTAGAVPGGAMDNLAITSFVLGLLAPFCCGLITGIPAIICGHMSLSRFSNDPHLQGKGFAIAGLVLGYLGLLISLLSIGLSIGPMMENFRQMAEDSAP